jgi:arsenical pump membrane protein
VFDGHMPPLLQWLARFGLPSVVSIAVTYAILRWTQRMRLAKPTEENPHIPSLTREGRIVGIALIGAAVLLLLASAIGLDLGLPGFIAGVVTLAIVLFLRGFRTLAVVKHVSWRVLPLVAELFAFVEALDRSGGLKFLSDRLRAGSHGAPALTAWIAALITGFGSNVANNLPSLPQFQDQKSAVSSLARSSARAASTPVPSGSPRAKAHMIDSRTASAKRLSMRPRRCSQCHSTSDKQRTKLT